MEVYAVEINPCVYESEFKVHALYRLESNAHKALGRLKDGYLKSHNELPDWVVFRVRKMIVRD